MHIYDNETCMLRKCDQCPGEDGILQFLTSCVDDLNTESVEHSNWVHLAIKSKDSESSISSRVTHENFKILFNEFSDNLVEDILNMTEHHFISVNQKDFFTECKNNLYHDTRIFIMDFAENYTFISQNSTKGFYFNNTSASLFTIALYFKEQTGNDVKHKTFCVISDSSIHQAYSVHKFTEVVLTRRVHTLQETDFRRHWRVDFWYLKMKPSVPNSIS